MPSKWREARMKCRKGGKKARDGKDKAGLMEGDEREQ